MSAPNGAGYTNGGLQLSVPEDDDFDVEEETLANDYQEQMQYNDAYDEASVAYSAGQQDIQAQLQAAVQPLDRDATLDVKFASYDNYCSLFHYILNSEGPVELELPSVILYRQVNLETILSNSVLSTIGHGMSLMSSSTSSIIFVHIDRELPVKQTHPKRSTFCASHQTLGAVTMFSMFSTPLFKNPKSLTN